MIRQSESDAVSALTLANAIVDAERNGGDWPKLAEGRARYNPFCDELDGASKAAVRMLAAELTIAAESLVAMTDERDAYRAMVCDLLASAHPNAKEHPTMTKQWARARELLKNGPTQ